MTVPICCLGTEQGVLSGVLKLFQRIQLPCCIRQMTYCLLHIGNSQWMYQCTWIINMTLWLGSNAQRGVFTRGMNTILPKNIPIFGVLVMLVECAVWHLPQVHNWVEMLSSCALYRRICIHGVAQLTYSGFSFNMALFCICTLPLCALALWSKKIKNTACKSISIWKFSQMCVELSGQHLLFRTPQNVIFIVILSFLCRCLGSISPQGSMEFILILTKNIIIDSR